MSLWSTISQKIREILRKMIGARTIEQVLHVSPVLSSEMENAIELWANMYENKAPWLHEPTRENPSRVASLGLSSMIASEKARMALLEMQSEITTPTEEVDVPNPDYVPIEQQEPDAFGNIVPSSQPETIKENKPISNEERARYLNKQYEKLKKQLRTQIEYGIAKGGLIIKPYIITKDTEKSASVGGNRLDQNDIYTSIDTEFDFIQADCFYPLAYDVAGKITEAAFVQTKVEKDNIYRRLEYHKWQNNTVTVINKAFKAANNATQTMTGLDLGQEVPLSTIPEWKDLQETTTVRNVNRPLFAYFKMPEANTVDTKSPLGVSGYSRAVQLIKDADMQYSRLLWEYEGGELAIDIDRDALNFMDDGSGTGGSSVMGQLQSRLYRKVDLGESNTYEPYSPALRDSSFLQGLNTILMRIEDVTGLSRGTLSDPASEARTATELKILKQRSYQTNADIQKAIQDMLEDVIYIMDAYCDLYQITPPGEYDVSFDWDDSIITDVDTELGKRITLMQNGLTSKIETRMWYFGETEQQARLALLQIDEENRKAMEDNLMEQANLANITSRTGNA